MAHEPNDTSREQLTSAGNRDDATVLERVQELTWAAIDNAASDEDVRLLENLLLSDDQAVREYLGCVQLHAGLLAEFATESAAAQTDTATFGFPTK